MTSLNHSNNLCLVTLYFPSSTPPASSGASSSSTSSTGWTQKITKKIGKLKSELENLNDLKKAKNGYLTEQDSKSLYSLPTQLTSLETMQKLAEFADTLDTVKHPSNNILNNLCTGLETLLGFNPASKGYDGSGIVYSDLDRLCDGVMGFLYQVLKDVSEKQPYSVGKETLKNLVSNVINTHLCSGHEGFKKLFGVLPGRIEKYNGEVRESNDRVRNIIKEMQKNVDDKFTQSVRYLLPPRHEDNPERLKEAKKQVNDMVEKCKQSAETFTTKLDANLDNNNNKNAIKDLNITLRDKLENARKTINYENDQLQKLRETEHKNLEETEEKIQTTLEGLRCKVNEHIKKKVEELVKKLKERVGEMKTKLVDIEKKLAEYVNDLGKWIENSMKYITAAQKEVKRITHEVDGDGGAKNLNRLNQEITNVENGLKQRVAELDAWIKAARELLEKTERTAKDEVYEKMNPSKNEEHTHPIGYHVGELNKAHGKDEKVSATDGSIQYVLQNGVQKALSEAGTLVDENLEDIGNPKSLFNDIDEAATGIYNSASSIHSQLNTKIATIVSNLEAICTVISTSKQGITVIEGERGLGEKLKDLEKALAEDIQQALDSLDKHRGSYGPYNTVKEAFDKVLAAVTEQLKGIQEPKNTAAKTSSSPTAEIATQIQQSMIKTKQTFDKAVSDLQSRMGKLAGQRGTSNSMDQVSAGVAIKQLNEISKSVGEANSKLITLLKVTQDEIENTANAIWGKSAGLGSGTLFDGTGLMKDVHEQVEKIKNEVMNKIGDTNKSGLRSKIEATRSALHGVANQIKNKLEADIRDKLTGIQTTIQQSVNTITQQLTTLRGTLNEHVIAKITDLKDNGLKTSDNAWGNNEAKGLATIKDEINNLQTAGIKSVNDELHELRIAIRMSARDVHTQLRDLKDVTIDNYLQDIKNNIHSLRTKDLDKAIKLTDNFITLYADRAGDRIIEGLEQDANIEVETARNILINHAQKQYISFIKTSLQTFAEKVGDELSRLPQDIDDDLKIGHKGFMVRLHGAMTSKNMNVNLVAAKTAEEVKQLSTAFTNFWQPLHDYILKEIKRLHDDENSKKNPQVTDADKYSEKQKYIHFRLTVLLKHIARASHFDHEIPLMLDDLTSALPMLKPDGFSKPNSPLLDCIVAGLGAFAGELEKAYISKYLGAEPTREWLTDAPTESKDTAEKKQMLTDDGRNCAKVFLTSLQILAGSFQELRMEYSACSNEQIHSGDVDKPNGKIIDGQKERVKNALGLFLVYCGYKVATDKAKEDGELRNKGMTGREVFDLCYNDIAVSVETKKLLGDASMTGADKVELHKLLDFLYEHLQTYYAVCHRRHIPKPTTPSNVYQMLLWLTGLTHTAVYSKLTVSGFGDLFEKRDAPKLQDDGESVSFGDDSSETLDAYPRPISVGNLSSTLVEVCAYAEHVLIAILGHGHESGIYAVDFNTNADNLLYPTTASACLDMLADILARVYHQCVFIYSQCRNSQYSSGWADCLYGRGIGGSAWTCNTKQCANQNVDQTGDQTCNQNCKQHPKCGVKSPLQSFLEDGLPGFLPHSFTKPGCKWECTVPNHRGIPCKTPMGFRYISQVASHVQTGAHLRKALADFCGTSSALTQLCGMLTCLTRQTPQTLGDLFAFYHGLLENFDKTKHKSVAFQQAINKAYFGEQYEKLQVVSIQKTSEHGPESSVDECSHLKGDLYTLVRCNGKTNPAYPCGPYLQPLTLQTRSMFSDKHAGNYLSWIVYLTETFYNLLNKLYQECCKKCATPGTRCCDKSCIRTCPVKYPAKPVNKELKSKKHSEDCNSIVKCPDTHPTLYKYGFTFGSPHELSGKKGDAKIRTCADFCTALEKVLHKDSVLIALIKAIDEFLFDIRDKFFWTTVALWSLSLFYLLCVMVGRLDVLHIRSHLRTPSSHRITAQSLLAAAHVGRLAKISYLQP